MTQEQIQLIRDLRDALEATRVVVACYSIGHRPSPATMDAYAKGPDAIARAGEVLRGVGE